LNTPAGTQILDARKLAKSTDAYAATLAENSHLILQAYTEIPNHEIVLACILRYGCAELPARCFLQPGVPVKVMLGKPTNGVAAILDKFQALLFTLEYKYDGERAQVHLLPDGRVMIYSRNSEDHTPKYPDVITNLPHAYNTVLGEGRKKADVEDITDEEKKDADMTDASAAAASTPASGASSSTAAASSSSALVQSFIIDCEVVAWDRVQRKILPFQSLSTRKRKDVDAAEVTVQVCLFAFDLLFMSVHTRGRQKC
jgi:DNA ligase-1